MSLIEKLVEWRLDNFMNEMGIVLVKNKYTLTKINIQEIRTKLILSGYMKNASDSYYCAIKNIIWKNILNCNIVSYSGCFHDVDVHMLYNNYHEKYLNIDFNPIVRSQLLGISKTSKDNMDQLEKTIIHYLMLCNSIIEKYIISDLTTLANNYMYDVLLII